MLLSTILGVIVIVRNGDRLSYYQDPETYAGGVAETTALGEADSFNLGSYLRSTYLDPASANYINDISFDLADTKEVKTLIKTGVEGNVVFDSAIALLQGLYPPTPNNKISLANGSTVVAPLGGYQYVPVETVEPNNDRSLESWTDCHAFEEHTKRFYASEAFKNKEKDAQPFFEAVRDYVFGSQLSLKNAWNVYDFINTQLVHNQTYAYRLPPSLVNQARAYANFHENGVFSDSDIGGIGNIAGRTLLHTILNSLERIAYDHNPLKFMLVQTTYQPFISFFHMMGMTKEYPELQGIPDYTSAIAIELRRGRFPEARDFIRVKFRNGTSGSFRELHFFDHGKDVPLTEFIYRTERAAITSTKQWQEVCNRAGPSSSVGQAHRQSKFKFRSMFNLSAVAGAVEVSEYVRGVVVGALSVLGVLGFMLLVERVRLRMTRGRSRSDSLLGDNNMNRGSGPEMRALLGGYGAVSVAA